METGAATSLESLQVTNINHVLIVHYAELRWLCNQRSKLEGELEAIQHDQENNGGSVPKDKKRRFALIPIELNKIEEEIRSICLTIRNREKELRYKMCKMF